MPGTALEASAHFPLSSNEPLGSEYIRWGDNETEVRNCFVQSL